MVGMYYVRRIFLIRKNFRRTVIGSETFIILDSLYSPSLAVQSFAVFR